MPAQAASVSVYAYNVTKVKLDSLQIGGVTVATDVPPLLPGHAPTPSSSFQISGNASIQATFSDRTTWTANVFQVPGAAPALALWIGINGFFGTTSDGRVQQFGFWSAAAVRFRTLLDAMRTYVRTK
jgi:hypothetical protein